MWNALDKPEFSSVQEIPSQVNLTLTLKSESDQADWKLRVSHYLGLLQSSIPPSKNRNLPGAHKQGMAACPTTTVALTH